MPPNASEFRPTEISPILGRRNFAVQVLERARTRRGMLFVADGAAGMGKTYLLRELVSAADLASQKGNVNVAFLRADEFESAEPYSFIERLAASLAHSGWDYEPEALSSPVKVARECISFLVPADEDVLNVVVIDDAQWIDVESQRALRYLIPRVIRRNVLLAFGARTPHAPNSFGAFLSELVDSNPHDTAYHVQPLTAQEIAALAEDRLGTVIPAGTLKRMLEVTGGSFLSVDSMLSTVTPEEIALLQFSWDTPIRANSVENDLLLHQFSQLGESTQRTCEIVCLAGDEVTREVLQAAAAKLGEPVALSDAITSGTLHESGLGTTIMPRHALVGSAIAASVSPARKRAVFQALAAVTTGHRSLHHALRAAQQWDSGLRDRVNEFVAESVAKGNLTVAGEVLRTALDIAEDPQARMELITSLALVHMQSKTGYAMLEFLDEIAEFPPSILHEAIYIIVAAHRVNEPLPALRVQALLAAQPETPEDKTVLAHFAFMVVILSMRTNDISRVPALIALAKHLVMLAPADASDLDDRRLEWMLDQPGHLLVLDAYLMVQDQFAGEHERMIAAIPGLMERIESLADSPLKVDAMVAVAGTELSRGNLTRGAALARGAVEQLEHMSEPWAAGTARLMFADSLVLQGEMTQAWDFMALTEEMAFAALDVEIRATWAALRTIIASATAREDAEALAMRSRNHRAANWEGYSPDLSIIAECEFRRSTNDAEGVLRASADPRGTLLGNTRRGFLTYRAHAFIDTGQVQEATELVEQLAQWRGTLWLEYWGTLDWLQARLAQARGEHQIAQWHYERATTQRACQLPLGLTLADFGEFLLAQEKTAEGISALTEAKTVLERIGAASYLERVQRALATVTVAPAGDAVRKRVLDSLTERERQIVEHLVRGRSNDQIAESLVVSVTTVRSHVSNVLRKIGVSSRGEVAKLLRERDELA